MNIKKVTLQNSGFKGAVVTYLREEQKNGRPFINEVIEKRKHPIHLGLEKMFKDLRPFLLEITTLLRGDEDKQTKQFTIQECEVTGIEFDALSFTLIGEKKIFADKAIKLKTCKVEAEDNYEHFETVQKLIESIVDETKEYLAGTKKVDDVEVAIRFIQSGKHKELTEESLKGYSPEQLKEFATKLLENNFGSVVMHNDDFEPDAQVLSEAVEKELAMSEEIIITEDETVIPLPKEKPKKEKKVKESKVNNIEFVKHPQFDVPLEQLQEQKEAIKPAF